MYVRVRPSSHTPANGCATARLVRKAQSTSPSVFLLFQSVPFTETISNVMAIAESILPDFDHEAATTRLLLERVPAGRTDFKPHDKSMTLGELAMHIATLPQWAPIALRQTEFDTNPPGGTSYSAPSFESVTDMLDTYDESVAAARAMLVAATDAELMVAWTLKNAGQKLFSMPRVGVFRTFIMN